MTEDRGRTGWRDVAAEVRGMIHERRWPPGSQLPNEAEIAAEIRVSRATVNRALRALAEEGLLERRRRAGTRVALHPVRTARLPIRLIREEVEAAGKAYGYRLLFREARPPSPDAINRLGLPLTRSVKLKSDDPVPVPCLHLRALHLADGAPYAHEDRWIDSVTVPGVFDVDFAAVSANEWLLRNVPIVGGEVLLGARAVSGAVAEAMGCPPGTGILMAERKTWGWDGPITAVRTVFAPGHILKLDV